MGKKYLLPANYMGSYWERREEELTGFLPAPRLPALRPDPAPPRDGYSVRAALLMLLGSILATQLIFTIVRLWR